MPPDNVTKELTKEGQAAADRKAHLLAHSFYCPGCGKVSTYPRECKGASKEAPHPPIEMVPTDELKGDDPSKYTPAPPSE